MLWWRLAGCGLVCSIDNRHPLTYNVKMSAQRLALLITGETQSMRQGLTLNELADELEYQQENKRDFIIQTKAAYIVPEFAEQGPYGIVIKNGKQQEGFELSRHTMTQLATHTKVPISLIDVMAQGTKRERAELGQLLTVRLQENNTKRMIRTLVRREDGEPYARAFLSDSYRRMDNYDLAEAVIPTLNELKGLELKSCDITETRMYLKMTYPDNAFDMGRPARDSKERKVGDIVEAGMVISNSEVGAGRILVEPLLHILRCLNGMVFNEAGVRRRHVGRAHGNGWEDDGFELFTDETKALDDAAFFAKVRDTVVSTLTDEGKFENMVIRFMEKRGEKIVGHPQAVVQELAKKYTLAQEESQSVLKHLINGGDLSQFGLINAVTAAGRSKKLTYDRCSELERMGGNILELGPSEWKTIATAKLSKKGPKGAELN